MIGDLFRAKPDDVQETINAVYFLVKQRMADFELKQEAKARVITNMQTYFDFRA